jgi:phosphoglycerate dehydrogenase-like enzyme
MATSFRKSWLVSFGFAALFVLPDTPYAAAAPEVAGVISRLRVEEAPRPQRDNDQWHAPRKILLLAANNPALDAQAATFGAVAGGSRVVVAHDLATAVAEAADADVILGFNPEICDPRILSGAQQLRWLASLSAGIEQCAGQAIVRKPGLLMTNMRGVDSAAIAEHAVAMMMALAHGLDVFAADTAKGTWSRQSAGSTAMQMLDGKTLLVVGLGGIGTEVAVRAHGLGMKVVATREGGTGKPDFVEHVGAPDELLTLARTADVIVSAVPLTPQTTGLYDAKFFAVLKPTALFINVARGGSVVTAELVKALNEHRLGGAGLDVVDPEPLPPEHPLWHAPRVLITPHISSRSDLPGDSRWLLATENLRRYVAGEKMLLVVDPQRGY